MAITNKAKEKKASKELEKEITRRKQLGLDTLSFSHTISFVSGNSFEHTVSMCTADQLERNCHEKTIVENGDVKTLCVCPGDDEFP